MKTIKKTAIMLCLAVLKYVPANSQVNVSNAEMYTIGTSITYQNCSDNGVQPGSKGENITWDFSNLKSLENKTHVKIENPKNTTYGHLAPEANIVEVASDSTYVYMNQSESKSELVAFYSKTTDLAIHYPKNQVLLSRPIVFGDSIGDSYSTDYTSAGYHFKGLGKTSIVADGYGKLKLPNGDIKQVLRVKSIQSQLDTFLGTPNLYESIATSYLWFDGIHPEPLLRILDYTFDGQTTRLVSYRVNSTTVNVRKIQEMEQSVFPNPAKSHFVIRTENSNIGPYALFDNLGRVAKEGYIKDNRTVVTTDDLPSGIYSLKLRTGSIKVQVIK